MITINNFIKQFATSEEVLKFIDTVVELTVNDFQSDWFKIDRPQVVRELKEEYAYDGSIITLKLRNMGVESTFMQLTPVILHTNERIKKSKDTICYIHLVRHIGKKFEVQVGSSEYIETLI